MVVSYYDGLGLCCYHPVMVSQYGVAFSKRSYAYLIFKNGVTHNTHFEEEEKEEEFLQYRIIVFYIGFIIEDMAKE